MLKLYTIMLKEKSYSLDFSAALPWLCMTSCGFNAQDLLSCKETVVHRRERDSISNSTRVFIYYYRIGQQCAKNINYLMALNCISWADFPQTNFKFNFPNVFRKCLLPSFSSFFRVFRSWIWMVLPGLAQKQISFSLFVH